MTALFSEAVGRDGWVFAVEITPEFLQHIREQASATGVTNMSLVLCSEDSVGLPPDSIELAFICDVYHHLEFPQSTMTSLHRALKPGGEIVVIDFERIEGKSREWVIGHVRAGSEQVIREIESVGFKLIPSPPDTSFLEENYFLRFRKVE